MKTMTEYRKIFNEKLDKTDNMDEAFTKAVWSGYLDGVEDGKKGIELPAWGKDQI